MMMMRAVAGMISRRNPKHLERLWKMYIVLTLRNVGASHSGADPPEADLEGDAGGGVTVGEAHGFASEQPHVADEGRQQCHQGQYAPQDAQPGECCAASRVAHHKNNTLHFVTSIYITVFVHA
jgi:hypothetical protein